MRAPLFIWAFSLAAAAGTENHDPSAVTGSNVFESNAGTGGWGGSCTCPDGSVYQVGDNVNDCGSLACVGGVAGQCNKHNGMWSHNKVTCATADPGCFPVEAVAEACADTVHGCEIHRRNGGCYETDSIHHDWRTRCVKTCGYCLDARYNPSAANFSYRSCRKCALPEPQQQSLNHWLIGSVDSTYPSDIPCRRDNPPCTHTTGPYDTQVVVPVDGNGCARCPDGFTPSFPTRGGEKHWEFWGKFQGGIGQIVCNRNLGGVRCSTAEQGMSCFKTVDETQTDVTLENALDQGGAPLEHQRIQDVLRKRTVLQVTCRVIKAIRCGAMPSDPKQPRVCVSTKKVFFVRYCRQDRPWDWGGGPRCSDCTGSKQAACHGNSKEWCCSTLHSQQITDAFVKWAKTRGGACAEVAAIS